MSFDWSEYLDLAEELADSSARSTLKEADLRSAVSRAYYAAFCTARNYLINRSGDESDFYGENVHRYVIETFENSDDRTHRVVGQLLRHLRSVRNVVDYKDEVYSLLSRTRGALSEADEVIRLVNGF